MTAAPPSAPAPAPSPAEAAPALSHSVRRAFARGRTWIVIGAAALLGAIVILVVQGGTASPGEPLAPDNAGPAGAMALAEVLQANGVDVERAPDLDAAITAGEGGATVLLVDPAGFLDAGQLGRLAASAELLVVASPHATTLDALAPGVRHGGTSAGAPGAADCALPAAERAGSLGELRVFGLDAEAEQAGWSGCFADEAGRFALVTGTDAGARTSIVDGALLANEHIDEAGNAALAIGLTGERERLAWYLPGIDDLAGGAAPDLAELTPGWVSPVLVLLLVATIWAGVWRGRRFGPLVAERLPVVVPSGETSAGRARLYERSGARLRAHDQLRIGAVGRLAGALGLGRSAGLDEIAGAAAARTGRAPAEVRRLLVDEPPGDDAALVALARELAAFEAAVTDALAAESGGGSRHPRPRPDDEPTTHTEDPR